MADEFSFDGVFDKAAGLATDFGSAYLTAKGQALIAQENAEAQSRLNNYSKVNPSLGAVNPAAAQQVANQTPVQTWLPWGTPVVGANATTTGVAGQSVAIYVALGLVVLVVLWKLLRK